MTNTVEIDIPLFIKVNPVDNTAIIVNTGGLKEGTLFSCGLVLTEFVPQGHKVALKDIHPNEEIVRYGEVIGYAQQLIPKGIGFGRSWSLCRRPLNWIHCLFQRK